jgi:chemotaxis protein methyltransferase CheR
LPTFDIVFIRNVLIYFDLDVKRDILRRIGQVISPDGFMLLGSSETTLDLDDHWDREAHGRVQLHRPAGYAAAAARAQNPSTAQSIAMTGA